MSPSRHDAALRGFHPLVRAWFTESLGAPSAPQREGWPAIATGRHALILAPTGTGKTLAAFLWELNALIAAGARKPLPNAVQILYISPLKALNNDIQRNLERPLADLRERFAAQGRKFPEIRVAVRTGDTPASARARMVRRTPHILITTPESLHIMLTSPRARTMFSAVRAVIVDEIHAVAGTKRGAHLALTLERLEASCERPPQRIGLSATQRPLDELARFLGGATDGGGDTPAFRPVTIVDCGAVKAMELAIASPVEDLGAIGGTVWPPVAALALRYIRESRTTLVFVNNRAQAERMAARINALAAEPLAQPYHGSLARERRLALEESLKSGSLRALVATSSLELGIDIGSVDLVLQLQSPKRVSSALQRVGRAGHTLAAVSRGVFIPTFRDDALEMAAIVRAMREGAVEPTRVVQNALDVLAQIIVAAASVDDWEEDALFALVRRAYPYHRLTRAAFDEVVAMLAGKYASELASELEPRIAWDRVTHRVSAPRGSRMLATISGGTIPDRGLYTVHLPDRTRLGELDEEFVHESRIGDVFQLGSSTWRIAAIDHDRVVVQPAPGAPARMPFWHGEFMARSFTLTPRVGELRRALAAARTVADLDAIVARYECDRATAVSLAEYAGQQRAATGVVPDDRTFLLEHFRDETGSVRVVLHAPVGGRVTAPWGMAIAQRVREALGGVDVQVQTTDDGLMLRLPDLGTDPPLQAFLDLSAAEAETRVIEEVGSSSLFGARFRMNAARALLLPRGTARRRMPLWLQRLKALDLLETVRGLPSFPILVETYRDVLRDAFDIDAMREVLGDIAEGRIRIEVARTEIPSPFAASLQFGFVIDWMYGDDTPRAEQRAAMLSLDRVMLEEVMGEASADAELRDEIRQYIAQTVAERRGTAPGRGARTADELALLLDRAGDVTMDELRERVSTDVGAVRGDPVRELLDRERAIGVPIRTATGTEWRMILLENLPRYAAAAGSAITRIRTGEALDERDASAAVPSALLEPVLTATAARREILARVVALAGPVTVTDVRARYDWPAAWIVEMLEEWERAGKLVRTGTRAAVGETEWCSRRVVEIARRRALAALRKSIEAVELPAYARFLQRWQRVEPATRRLGADGVADALRQLAGLARPGAAWERDYLPARVQRYDPATLSSLFASGAFVWMGEARRDDASGATALAAIRFFERGTGALWLGRDDAPPPGKNAAMVLDALVRLGASFFADLQAASGLSALALKDALRELVAGGLVTNDTADALREVVRTRALPPRPGGDADPTRWLPPGFTPSANRHVVQRRPNLRRLPKWRRPDRPAAAAGSAAWIGRWSLLATPGTLGPPLGASERAESIARLWLARYGIVSRDWWARERPPVPWRAIYRELRRLEMRGEVRRGYFVRGLAGAQFAPPAAVEQLRHPADARPPIFVLASSDPANPYLLALPGVARDPLSRPRGAAALLVMRGGHVIMSAEGRGKRISVASGLAEDEASEAASALVTHLVAGSAVVGGGRPRDVRIETIDGVAAAASRWGGAFAQAGFRVTSRGLRYFA